MLHKLRRNNSKDRRKPMSNDKILENQKKLESNLKKYSKMSQDELFKEYNSSINGLSVVEIEERQEKFGKNIIDIKNKHTIFERLKESIINPFNIVLILVSAITFITDVIIPAKPDYSTFILIISAILISSIISFVEQEKSDKAARKLQKMISNKLEVIRDEVLYEIDVEDAVPGDIVKLSSGDMLPGDVRFLEAKDLFIDQASLTR